MLSQIILHRDLVILDEKINSAGGHAKIYFHIELFGHLATMVTCEVLDYAGSCCMKYLNQQGTCCNKLVI
jgi:hypothetical protein